MKFISLLAASFVFTTMSLVTFAQDSLITEIAKKNFITFSIDKKSFVGKGWDTLVSHIQKSDFVLIGEDHFTNDIPFFFSAVADKVKFDNFFCEIDPYSAKIIESKIKNLTDQQLRKYEEDFGNVFSFFAFESEFH